MPFCSVCNSFNKVWTYTGTSTFNRFINSFDDCFYIIAVDGYTLNPIGNASFRYWICRYKLFYRHCFTILVVFQNVYYRQFPYCRQV